MSARRHPVEHDAHNVRLHLLERRETLFAFKQKFQPRWESRYLVTDATLSLPRVALAVFRLRNYAGGG